MRLSTSHRARQSALFVGGTKLPLDPSRGLGNDGSSPWTTSGSSATALCMSAHTSWPMARILPSTTATAMLTSASPGVGFLKLLLAFVSGGLFFSTAIAAVTACYAIGLDNVKRVWDIVKLVLRSVWISFTLALSAAKIALRQDGSWKWKEAWQVLKARLAETRQKAAEGVQAIRQEASLYAAAVGAPGLIVLQYVVDRLFPLSLAAAMEESLQDTLQTVKNRNVKKLTLVSFGIGKKTPKLEAARVYDLGDKGMAFDCDMEWNSQVSAVINLYTAGGLARLPVEIKNIRFDGVVRVILAPLTKAPPGFGAILVSLPSVPKIGLDVRIAGGDITRIPWLRSELMNAIQKGIADELLWPRRIVIPSTLPTATKPKPLLSKAELDLLVSTDPLLRAEKALQERPILRDQMEDAQSDVKALRKLTKIFFNPKEDANGTGHTTENPAGIAEGSELGDKTGNAPHVTSIDLRKHMATIQNGVLLGPIFQSFQQR
jgi:hypothetical protein